ncbi:MAG: amidohydrolase family protein [Xanthomonadaceae bacterium]|nr:amidohydrolase family protein [Xanthomonadaceae bacterium]MDE2084086.1 amidohydrolase family protein [Xanthomonadaceae bacterium]MDE2256394.1 amidohydrolase family protein [Xanthomonadaceae bacterium]
MRIVPLAAALAAVFAAPAFAAPLSPSVTVLQCAHLIDVLHGKLLGASTIVIEGDRIAQVLDGTQQRAGANTVAVTGTCMPGLIDDHVHLTMQFDRAFYSKVFRLNPADYAIQSTVYARRTLLAGFTTVRNVGDFHNESIALRNAVNQGEVPGPRIFSAGQFIGTTGGHADPTDGYRWDLQGDPSPKDGIINSPEDAWKAVRQHYKDGADLIKIMPSGGVLDESGSAENPQMTIPEIQAIVAAAHDYGFTVAAHAHGAEAIRRAVIGGVDSIEHGTFMNAEDMKLMKEHGTWYVPTIIAGQFVMEKAKEGWYPPQVARKAMQVGPIIMATAGKAYKAGVKIAFGTDAGVYPHGENAKEFEYMVEAGMPPMFTIQAATMHAAELLKHDKDVGSIEPGKYADVVAVPGNPLNDIKLMQKVDFVMKGGVVYEQDGQPIAAALDK